MQQKSGMVAYRGSTRAYYGVDDYSEYSVRPSHTALSAPVEFGWFGDFLTKPFVKAAEAVADVATSAVHVVVHAAGSVVHAIGNAISSFGRALGSALKWMAKGVQDLGDIIRKIPVIGGLLHGVYDFMAAPVTLAAAIASGKRIDRALVDSFKRAVSDIAEVAPWVTAVISLVPGIGPIASAVITGALALAQGQTITEALISAAIAAMPGGSLARIAFNAGKNVAYGHSFKQITMDLADDFSRATGLPIPPMQRLCMETGIDMTTQLARGGRVDAAALAAAGKVLPDLLGPPAQKLLHDATAPMVDKATQALAQSEIATALSDAYKKIPNITGAAISAIDSGLKVGLTLGNAINIQKIIGKNVTAPALVNDLIQKGQDDARDAADRAMIALADKGKKLVLSTAGNITQMAQDLALSEGRKILPADVCRGFDLAIGMSQHKVSTIEYLSMRDHLAPAEKKGFDLGASFHVGRIAIKPPKPLRGVGMATQAKRNMGYLATVGMMGNPPANKTAMVAVLAADPAIKSGVVHAVLSAADERSTGGFWDSILKFFGLA